MEAIDKWEEEEEFEKHGRCRLNQNLVCADCGCCNINEDEI